MAAAGHYEVYGAMKYFMLYNRYMSVMACMYGIVKVYGSNLLFVESGNVLF